MFDHAVKVFFEIKLSSSCFCWACEYVVKALAMSIICMGRSSPMRPDRFSRLCPREGTRSALSAYGSSFWDVIRRGNLTSRINGFRWVSARIGVEPARRITL